MTLVKAKSKIVSNSNNKLSKLQQQEQRSDYQRQTYNNNNTNDNNNKCNNNNIEDTNALAINNSITNPTVLSCFNDPCHRNVQPVTITRIHQATILSFLTDTKASTTSSPSATLLQLQIPTAVVIPKKETITEAETGTRLTIISACDIVTVSNVKVTSPPTLTTAATYLLTNTAKQCHKSIILSLLTLGMRAISRRTSIIRVATTKATPKPKPKPRTATTTAAKTIIDLKINLYTKCETVKNVITCSSKTAEATTTITNNSIKRLAKTNPNRTDIKGVIKTTFRTKQNPKELVWLLPLVMLIAIFSGGNAGFACLSNPCVFGVCIDGLNSSYSCYCIDGYTGIQCQTNWDECWSGPCQNGGTCIDGVAYYNCTCPDGFSGVDCEENVDECMSNPCQNGGHCRDRNNGYTCTCTPGYTGDHCEIDVAVCEIGTGARCQNGGECVEGPGLEFTCECSPGWHGRICQNEINECESSPCLNGGVCVDKLANYVCACPMGYTGTNCEEEILICSENPCENNALCLMEESIPTCYCVPDYHGEKCQYQYDECQLGPRCMNGGICIDGVDTFSCSCPPLLTGMLCECLMIGEDSLDCNYTAPTAITIMVPSLAPIKPTAWIATTHPYVKPTKSESEVKKEESLGKQITEIHSPIEVPSSTTKIAYPTPPSYWSEVDISASYTTETPSGSYQTSFGESEESLTYSEVSGSEEEAFSEEFTTRAHFDVNLSSEHTTSSPSLILPHDYSTMKKITETTPKDGKDFYYYETSGKGFSVLPPTWPSYHKTSHLTTPVSAWYDTKRYTTERVTSPSIFITTPKPPSEIEFTSEIYATKNDTGHEMFPTTPKYMSPSISEPKFLPTTVAPFFTDIPEVVVTTKYYDFKYKDKGRNYSDGVTYRPQVSTYSITTIAKYPDYEESVTGTSSPGISITVYSPENHTYLYHRPTPKIPPTMKTKLYQETSTPSYEHIPTTIKVPYHTIHPYTTTASLPSYPFYTKDARTQKIPVYQTTSIKPTYKPDYAFSVTPIQLETTYTSSPTYRATLGPSAKATTTTTFKSLTEMPITHITQYILPIETTKKQESTLLSQPTIPAIPQSTILTAQERTPPQPQTTMPSVEPTDYYHIDSTWASQITEQTLVPFPVHPTIATLPHTTTKQVKPHTLPSFTTYTPPSVHIKPSVKYPSTQSKDISEEEEPSINTVSPEIIDINIKPPTSEFSPDLRPDTVTKTVIDCVTMSCYNGGTCVTTSEGSRCICRFDRQGALCEAPIIIKNAAFSGDSYVSHRIHKDITHHDTLDTVLPMHVQLKVRTRATNGLIMLAAAQGTKGGHYMALFLQKGLLQFQFSCGLQTMLLSELETPVNTGHEITIRAELDFSRNYTHCNASLLVNDTLAMSGDQPTWLKLLPTRMHTSDVILNTWLHLGGAPQAPIGLIIELPPSQSGSGFTGCLHSLRINNENREIFGEALDGFSITECGSLACLSSPCRNGAACIKIETNEYDENGDKIEKWKCKCPTGYMGTTCEISVCENNPCQYGGTCVQFPGSGYLCLCPLGKHGHYCEHNLEVALPSFSGSVNGLSSYVAYTVPIPLEYSMELSFKILPQTMSQIALLAFLGQTGYHDEKSDHLAVSFIQGYIMLTWNLGSGPRRIFTQKAIDFRLDAPRVPYEIKVGRIGRQAWLSVDGKFNITGRSPGTVSRMDVIPVLYLGGHEIANFHTLPHDLPLHSGFQGCIYDVHLKAGQVMVPLQETRGVRGRGVGQCGTRECHRHACQHDGACLQHGATFTCICQEGWYGPLCAQPINPCDSLNNKCLDEATCVPLVNGYECDCPVGKTGKNCEENIHSLSDVSLTGRRSYLAVKWPYLYDSTDKLGTKRSQMFSYRNYTKKFMPAKPITSTNQHFVMKLLNEVEKQRGFAPIPLKSAYDEQHHRVQFFFIEFQLRPLSERGLLLYFGTLNNNQDRKIGFVSLSLQGGVVEFRISGPNSHVTVVRSVRMLAIGEWHKIKMAQRGRWLTLWVEGSASSALSPTAEVLVEPDSLLYVGGLKDLSKLPPNAISGFPMSFRGCVRGLVVSGTRIVLNETNIIESRNIRDCDGTACGGDSCEAGGHCWLDEKLQPHCICPEYARGDRCEYSETCKLIPCRNNGRCLRSGRCSCQNGWGGFYCEISLVKPTTPSFHGNSYLILPPPRIPMKDKRKGPSIYLRPREAVQVSLNFSTIEPNGLLLWSEQDAMKFLGLGLENGHLKLASNLLGSINDTVSTPSGGFITDGSWHTVKIIIDRGRLELQLDGEVVFSEKLSLIENLMSSSPTMLPSSTPSLLTYRNRIRSSLAGRKGRNQYSITYENVFYLGGFPNLESVAKRTRGRFTTPFKGCLQDIQFGMETNKMITDFSKYHGENIGSCDLHGDEPTIMA